MFNIDREQKVFDIGGAKVGGQPGANPPLVLPSLFQKGDPCVESRRERRFDKKKAAEQIKRLEELSDLTGIPAIVAMVANSGEEMKNYIDFYVQTTDIPFAIDMWKMDPRLEATKYVAEQGLQDRLLYNSVTVWSEDVESEVEQIKELGVKHLVTVVMDMVDQSPNGRITALDDMPVSYTHLRAHETKANLVCRLLLEKKKTKQYNHTRNHKTTKTKKKKKKKKNKKK